MTHKDKIQDINQRYLLDEEPAKLLEQQAAKIERLKELHEMASQDVLNGIDIINRKDAKIEKLKEILTKDIVTIESVIQEITTNRNIHDTLWLDDYNTMVDVLNAMLEEKKTIKNGYTVERIER